MEMMYSRHERGFTLVELMVALLIGLLVILGASQIFLSARQSFVSMEALALRQESLRFVVDVVALDIRSSGVENINDDASKQLDLGYTTRTADPYCTGVDLVSVRYSFFEGDVRVEYNCGSGWVGPQVLISGLDDADFVYNEAKGYVDVYLDFPQMPGEEQSATSFVFRVANREGVTR